MEAAVAQGFKRVHDFNGAEQNGADGYPVDVVDGVRQNVGLVYLTEQVRRRPNLTIRGDVNIDRVLFDGAIAIGVLAADGTSTGAAKSSSPAAPTAARPSCSAPASARPMT